MCVEITKLINNQLNGSCVTKGPSMNVPHHMGLIRQLSILVKRFKLRKGKIGVEASKELLREIGTGRSASSDQK